MTAYPESMDPLGIDQILDVEGTTFSSPFSSSSSSFSAPSKGKGIASPVLRTPAPQRLSIRPPQPTNLDLFAGPSHQYNDHRQQTSLPLGGLADSLAATRQPNFGGYGGFHGQYRMGSSSGLPDLTLNDDSFDFGGGHSAATHKTSFSAASDVDMDFDSGDGFFSFNDTSPGSDTIDPNALGGQEDDSPTPVLSKVEKVWPGHHTQQAALAKQQQEQQQQQQQQEMKPPASKAAPASANHKRNASSRPVDPDMEKSISRILDQMRHNSDAGADASPPPIGGLPHVARAKKDEEDMDDDERLLASEEGKKLSSKERRQLRNKVSARAFRSRRKEYIGQLEGELAAKGQEVDDLRTQNDELRTENTRLTDLTRLLLSSPAFSTFLDELSSNGAPTLPSNSTSAQQQQQSQQQPQQPQQQQKPQRTVKDVNPHSQPAKVEQQGDMQVNMTMIPETSMDFPGADALAAGWGSGIDFGMNLQVFAVTDIPEGPAVDTAALSEKPSETPATPVATDFPTEAKSDIPAIEAAPQRTVKEPAAAVPDEEVDLDESDPAFALFIDAPTATTASAPSPSVEEYQVFGSIQPEKAFARVDLVVFSTESSASCDENGIVDAEAMARFEKMCSSLDSISNRLAGFTCHLL